ncbi:MAG: hypothetical protein ACRC10_13155 [Thermoguttaceae bacterium]
MTSLQFSTRVEPGGILTIPALAPLQSRMVKIVVEEESVPASLALEREDPTLGGKISAELLGSIWETGDVLAPVDVV